MKVKSIHRPGTEAIRQIQSSKTKPEVISRFGFKGGIWVLIAPVLGHCLLVTFVMSQQKKKHPFVISFLLKEQDYKDYL